MRQPRYCLAHQPDISFNITRASHFSTPPTLVHKPPYPSWHTLSPIIMKKVLNFQENEDRI